MPISPNFTSVLSKDWEINFTQCTPNGYLKYTDLCNLLHNLPLDEKRRVIKAAAKLYGE